MKNRSTFILLLLALVLLVASPYAIGRVSGITTPPTPAPGAAKFTPWPPPPVEDYCSWLWGPPCAAPAKPTKPTK